MSVALVPNRAIHSLVFAPPWKTGGVKSLYAVCDWLDELGRCTIMPFGDTHALADWFEHRCRIFDFSYKPNLIVYPEVYQPDIPGGTFQICFALGRHQKIEPRCNLVVCKSPAVADWVKEDYPNMRQELIRPSIERRIFEYDGRPKRNIITYMTRAGKYPETAQDLRAIYGDQIVEIINCDEHGVAELLKDAKVFLWRGGDREGSPRPPKEALVAGCTVVGLKQDLHASLDTDFGIRCTTIDEMVHMAGEALTMDIPSEAVRSCVRDSREEREEWHALVNRLDLRSTG